MNVCGVIIYSFFILRVVIVIVVIIFFVICVIVISYVGVKGVRYNLDFYKKMLRWIIVDKNYIYYVIGDVFEWFIVLIFLGYLFIYFGEFRFVKMKIVVLR